MMGSFFILSVILLIAGCVHEPQPLPILSDKFSDIQKQTLNNSCAYSGCHDSSQNPGAYLSLVADSAYNQLLYTHQVQNRIGAARYKALVVPYCPDSSFLVEKLIDPNLSPDSLEGDRMPSRQRVLPQNQIDAIISWIKRGAPND